MRKSVSAVLLFSLILLFCAVSCASAGPLEKAVPANAIGYVHLESPEVFLTDIDSFLASMGLQMFLGDLSVRDMLNGVINNSNILNTESLDFARAAGFAVIPGSGDNEQGYLLILPVTEAFSLSSVVDILQSRNIHARQNKDYLLLASDEAFLKDVPAKKRLDLAPFASYPDNSLKFYMNLDELWDAAASIFDESMASAEDVQELSWARKILDGFWVLLKQMGPNWSGTTINQEGFASRWESETRGELNELLAKAAPASSLKESYALVDPQANYLQMVYEIDTATMEAAETLLFDTIFPDSAATLSPEILAFRENSKKLYQALGSRGGYAASFRLSPAETAAFLESGEFSDFFKAFEMDFLMVRDLKDPVLYKNLITEFYADSPSWKQFMNTLLKDSGMAFLFDIKEKKSPKGLSYWEIRMNFDFSSLAGDSSPEDAELMPALNQFFENFTFFTAIKDNLEITYLPFSSGGAEEQFFQRLEEYPHRESPPEWLVSVPDTANMAFKINLKSYLDTVIVMLSQNPGIGAMLPQEPREISAYMALSEKLSGGFTIPGEEFTWLFQYFVMYNMLSSMSSGS